MSERKRTTDDEARSTDRPPSPEAEIQRDIASAVKAARNNSPGRYGPPAATAKIRPFELAQALALASGDADAIHNLDKPPREDDAPFVPPEVEVVGEEEITSGIPSSGASSSKPPASLPKPESASPKEPSRPATKKAVASGLVSTLASEQEESKIVRAPRRSYTGLVVLALAVGVAVCAYVYLYSNR